MYRALTSFRTPTTDDARGRIVGLGEIVEADDPLVEKYPDLFEPVEDFLERKQVGVEQATAAPGETRKLKKKKSSKDSG